MRPRLKADSSVGWFRSIDLGKMLPHTFRGSIIAHPASLGSRQPVLGFVPRATGKRALQEQFPPQARYFFFPRQLHRTRLSAPGPPRLR